MSDETVHDKADQNPANLKSKPKNNGGRTLRERQIGRCLSRCHFLQEEGLIDQLNVTNFDPNSHWGRQFAKMTDDELKAADLETAAEEMRLTKCADDQMCYHLMDLIQSASDKQLQEIGGNQEGIDTLRENHWNVRYFKSFNEQENNEITNMTETLETSLGLARGQEVPLVHSPAVDQPPRQRPHREQRSPAKTQRLANTCIALMQLLEPYNHPVVKDVRYRQLLEFDLRDLHDYCAALRRAYEKVITQKARRGMVDEKKLQSVADEVARLKVEMNDPAKYVARNDNNFEILTQQAAADARQEVTNLKEQVQQLTAGAAAAAARAQAEVENLNRAAAVKFADAQVELNRVKETYESTKGRKKTPWVIIGALIVVVIVTIAIGDFPFFGKTSSVSNNLSPPADVIDLTKFQYTADDLK